MSDPRTIHLSRDLDPQAIERALSVLHGGGVILLPTETVYGLVAADTEAGRERLVALKGRGDKPFVRLVADLETALADGALAPDAARRLARRYWPGPLTLILERGAGTRGYRVPGSAFALELVRAARVPLLGTSANLSGEPATTDFEGAKAAVGELVDLLVAGGETPLLSPSTVVRVAPGQTPEVLREGFLERPSIERALKRTVVFVCTGNTCRSPMAEALFRRRLAERLEVEPEALQALGWEVQSAGVAAGPGGPAALHSQAIMRERGLDLEDHRSQPLGPDLADDAEAIVGLTPSHAAGILSRYPHAAERVFLLDPQGVPDPIGGSLELYRRTADHIDACLPGLLDELLAEEDEVEPEAAGPPLLAWPSELPPEFLPPEVEGLNYLVRGEVRVWAGKSAPVLSPVSLQAGGELTPVQLGESAQLSSKVAKQAFKAALKAWDGGRGAWPLAPAAERAASVRAFCEAIRPLRAQVAGLLSWEVGKPLAAAEKEFDRTIEYVDATLKALAEPGQGRPVQAGGVIGMTQRAPLGVVLCMGPFNYPFNETYTTLIPALLMGNTCVVKLPKLGVLCNLPLLDALAEHFPPGVVNVISGDGRELISPIMRSGKLDALAFIGSTRVARLIEQQHPAPYRLTTILGLEAKNPAVVLPSADLELAVAACLKGSLSFNGQRCTALKLLFVHRSLAEEFVERLGAAVEGLVCGMPWEPGVQITPLPEPDKPAELARLIKDALDKGARVVNPRGGRSEGSFVFPALLYPVSADMELFSVEQFGPLVPVVVYDELAEVEQAVAESPYGQQVSLFGQDPAELAPLIEALRTQVCRINLNRVCQRGPDSFPFTGRKDSAEGVLSVDEALLAFSIPCLLAASEGEGEELLRALRGKTRFLPQPPAEEGA